MSSCGYDASLFEHQNDVAMTNGAETVRNQYLGAIQIRDVACDQVFSKAVEAARGFVEDEN